MSSGKLLRTTASEPEVTTEFSDHRFNYINCSYRRNCYTFTVTKRIYKSKGKGFSYYCDCYWNYVAHDLNFCQHFFCSKLCRQTPSMLMKLHKNSCGFSFLFIWHIDCMRWLHKITHLKIVCENYEDRQRYISKINWGKTSARPSAIRCSLILVPIILNRCIGNLPIR